MFEIVEANCWRKAHISYLEQLTEKVLLARIAVTNWLPLKAGQHVDVRLTAEDGYQAQRSYSIIDASATDKDYTIAIEHVANGEISSYFHSVAQIGDEVEILGPIGGHFVWEHSNKNPILLIGSGSGVVPLLSIVGEKVRTKSEIPMVLLYGVKTHSDIIYHDQLKKWVGSSKNLSTRYAISREVKSNQADNYFSGHIDQGLIAESMMLLKNELPVDCYICGNNQFVDAMTKLLPENQFERIRTERFGE